MAPTRTRTSKGSDGRAQGYRSGLEEAVSGDLEFLGIPFDYEAFRLTYTLKPHKYLTDFILPNGIVIETKGYFVSKDRTKHLAIQKQHPGLDLRFVFSKPDTLIGKKSTTTYGKWCDMKGFRYAAVQIPAEWLQEPPCPERIEAARKAFGWEPPKWDQRGLARRLETRPLPPQKRPRKRKTTT